jgi:hypothetical protein
MMITPTKTMLFCLLVGAPHVALGSDSETTVICLDCEWDYYLSDYPDRICPDTECRGKLVDQEFKELLEEHEERLEELTELAGLDSDDEKKLKTFAQRSWVSAVSESNISLTTDQILKETLTYGTPDEYTEAIAKILVVKPECNIVNDNNLDILLREQRFKCRQCFTECTISDQGCPLTTCGYDNEESDWRTEMDESSSAPMCMLSELLEVNQDVMDKLREIKSAGRKAKKEPEATEPLPAHSFNRTLKKQSWEKKADEGSSSSPHFTSDEDYTSSPRSPAASPPAASSEADEGLHVFHYNPETCVEDLYKLCVNRDIMNKILIREDGNIIPFKTSIIFKQIMTQIEKKIKDLKTEINALESDEETEDQLELLCERIRPYHIIRKCFNPNPYKISLESGSVLCTNETTGTAVFLVCDERPNLKLESGEIVEDFEIVTRVIKMINLDQDKEARAHIAHGEKIYKMLSGSKRVAGPIDVFKGTFLDRQLRWDESSDEPSNEVKAAARRERVNKRRTEFKTDAEIVGSSSDECVYQVMEHYPTDLKKFCTKREVLLPLHQVRLHFRDACLAIKDLHDRNIVHRGGHDE